MKFILLEDDNMKFVTQNNYEFYKELPEVIAQETINILNKKRNKFGKKLSSLKQIVIRKINNVITGSKFEQFIRNEVLKNIDNIEGKNDFALFKSNETPIPIDKIISNTDILVRKIFFVLNDKIKQVDNFLENIKTIEDIDIKNISIDVIKKFYNTNSKDKNGDIVYFKDNFNAYDFVIKDNIIDGKNVPIYIDIKTTRSYVTENSIINKVIRKKPVPGVLYIIFEIKIDIDDLDKKIEDFLNNNNALLNQLYIKVIKIIKKRINDKITEFYNVISSIDIENLNIDNLQEILTILNKAISRNDK